MIEKYFTDDSVQVKEVVDNMVSLTFHCFTPSDGKTTPITLSDLGIARALGLDPKNYSREEFIATVSKSFPVAYGRYYIPDSEFPLPEEWAADAKGHIENSLKNKMFFAIDASYIRGLEPPLYAVCLLKEVIATYSNLPSKESFCPSDLDALASNPGVLFEDKITRMED